MYIIVKRGKCASKTKKHRQLEISQGNLYIYLQERDIYIYICLLFLRFSIINLFADIFKTMFYLPSATYTMQKSFFNFMTVFFFLLLFVFNPTMFLFNFFFFFLGGKHIRFNKKKRYNV